MTSSSRESLPALRRSSTTPSCTTATPAESYPRYSSRRSPSMRIGTTSLGPIYPMIPHIAFNFSLLTFAFCLLLDPALDVPLLARADRERAGGHVHADRGAAADIRTLADRHRRDELRIAADEGIVFDYRRVLLHAVVVARDRAGADVHTCADRGVAEIRQVHRLRSGPEHGLLQLDEIADARLLADVRFVSEMRERPDARAVRDRGVGDDAVVEHRHAIADPRVDDADAAVNLAVRPDGRPSLERHPGVDDLVRAHLDGRPRSEE